MPHCPLETYPRGPKRQRPVERDRLEERDRPRQTDRQAEGDRDRKWQTEADRDRQTERQAGTDTGRDKDKQTEASRQRDRQRQTQTDRQRQADGETGRDRGKNRDRRHIKTEAGRDRQTGRDRDRHQQTETEAGRDRQRQRQRQTLTDRQTDRDRDKQTEADVDSLHRRPCCHHQNESASEPGIFFSLAAFGNVSTQCSWTTSGFSAAKRLFVRHERLHRLHSIVQSFRFIKKKNCHRQRRFRIIFYTVSKSRSQHRFTTSFQQTTAVIGYVTGLV